MPTGAGSGRPIGRLHAVDQRVDQEPELDDEGQIAHRCWAPFRVTNPTSSDYSARRSQAVVTTSATLCPPKPNELLIAAS